MFRDFIPLHSSLRAIGFAAFILVAAPAAQAGNYEINYIGVNDPNINGDVFITTAATPTGRPVSVIGIKGERSGDAITALSQYAASDQLLYASDLRFDFGGLSFSTTAGGDFNLFSNNGAYYEVSSAVDPVGYASSGAPIVLFVSAVPEPTTLVLLAAGSCVIAVIRRRRRTASG